MGIRQHPVGTPERGVRRYQGNGATGPSRGIRPPSRIEAVHLLDQGLNRGECPKYQMVGLVMAQKPTREADQWLGPFGWWGLGVPTKEAPYGLQNGVHRHRGEIHHFPDWDMRAARSLWVLIILVRCPLICSRFFANAACCFKRFA